MRPVAVSGAQVSVSEADLAARALGGDPDAWGALAERHGRRLRLALLARGVPPDVAADVAQETWVRLMERQQRGELKELQLPGLAIVQAFFLASDERRRQARASGNVDADVAALDIVDGGASVEATVIGRDRLQRVRGVIQALPDKAQGVFHAVFGRADHRSYAEVARDLGLSQQRVKQIVCEIRAKVRAEMEEEDD